MGKNGGRSDGEVREYFHEFSDQEKTRSGSTADSTGNCAKDRHAEMRVRLRPSQGHREMHTHHSAATELEDGLTRTNPHYRRAM